MLPELLMIAFYLIQNIFICEYVFISVYVKIKDYKGPSRHIYTTNPVSVTQRASRKTAQRDCYESEHQEVRWETVSPRNGFINMTKTMMSKNVYMKGGKIPQGPTSRQKTIGS